MTEAQIFLAALIGGSVGGMLAAKQFKVPVWKGAVLALGSYMPAALLTSGIIGQFIITVVLAAIIASMMKLRAREASTILVGFLLFTIGTVALMGSLA